MLPEAVITHFISGRIRIRIPSKKGDGAFFLSMKERFSNFPGIRTVEVNSLTGSILILHAFDTRSLDIKKLTAYTESNGLFKVEERPLSGSSAPFIREKLGESVKGFDEKMKEMTSGELDLSTVAFLLLLGVGIYQIGAGNFAAPAWYVAFWYAMNIFMQAETRKGKSLQLEGANI